VTIGGDPTTGTHVALQLPLPRASHIQ